jgi:hypothetical protein
MALKQETSAAAPVATHRFAPLNEDAMTAEQKAVPSVKKALEAGTYNPNGFDAVFLRNPGLQDVLNAAAAKVYSLVAKLYYGKTDYKPAASAGLVEIGILLLSHEWDFPEMFPSHGPVAVEAGISQEIVDALARGERPARMKADEEAVYEFCAELIRKHAASDAAFDKLRRHLSERDILDLVVTLGLYTNSIMVLKATNIASH